MTIYHLMIRSDFSMETAWHELESGGIDVLYSGEDPDGKQKTIVCRLPPDLQPKDLHAEFACIASVEKGPDLSIDWEGQWKEHGLDFHDGFVHIHAGNSTFILKPGPGFGDASHPTTRLVLEMMEQVVPHRPVLDIGCGSGILSLAAAALGADPIYAIDIDPEAITHTKKNIALNKINTPIWVGTSDELIKQKHPKGFVALMNMISTEQEQAWDSLSPLHGDIQECITSGILVGNKDAYIKQWEGRGWKLESMLQEGEWAAFHFN